MCICPEPAGVENVGYYLSNGMGVNTPVGDGALGLSQSYAGNLDRFTYDPRDQRARAHRRDILIYQTEPLEQSVDPAG